MFQRLAARFAICISLALMAAPASAATVDWGVLTPTDTKSIGGGLYTGSPGSQAILDTYHFNLSDPSNAAVSAVDLEFGTFNFTELLVELFNGDPSDALECPTPAACLLASNSGSSGFLLSYANLLTAYDYVLRISGTFDSSGAGIYGGVLAVSEVPIPPALILFGTAIAGVAAFSRRRSQKQPVAA